MSDRSSIEWTDASWNPIRAIDLKTGKIGWHCEHATTGCINCYSETLNKRFGTGLPYKPGLRSQLSIFLDEKTLSMPLRWRKRRQIFVCSMTDAFADFVKDEWLDKMFAIMALCPQHTFQVLTKRAERMRDYFARVDARYRGVHGARAPLTGGAGAPAPFDWPLPNVWLGVSAEQQREANERILLLQETPAAIRFVSAEPLLGPIDFERGGFALHRPLVSPTGKRWPGVDWIIVGGESGHDARPCRVEWIDGIIDQCRSDGIACFVKQLGAVPLSSGYPLELESMKGGDPEEWPERLRVRQMPAFRKAEAA